MSNTQELESGEPVGGLSIDRWEPFHRALPSALAITPVSMLFGILAAKSDWSVFEVFAAGLLGFTGSGQFALLPLADVGTGFLTMLLLSVSINSRYLPIAFITRSRLPKRLLFRASIAHILGDEAYATERDSDDVVKTAIVRSTIFCVWVLAGTAGAILAELLPDGWLSDDIHFGFPASVVLMYLSVAQLRARLGGVYRYPLMVISLGALVAIAFIALLGPLYFWLPSVAATAFVLFSEKT